MALMIALVLVILFLLCLTFTIIGSERVSTLTTVMYVFNVLLIVGAGFVLFAISASVAKTFWYPIAHLLDQIINF